MKGTVLYRPRDIRFEDRATPTIVEPTFEERKEEPASVVILPVIRIERFAEPSKLQPPRGQPRRRRGPVRSA